MDNTRTCHTCCRPANAPFRRHDPEGRIVEGCIDECHTGLLDGASLEWHTRDTARAWRRKIAEYLTTLVGAPMRGYGLPGQLRFVGENRPVRDQAPRSVK